MHSCKDSDLKLAKNLFSSRKVALTYQTLYLDKLIDEHLFLNNRKFYFTFFKIPNYKISLVDVRILFNISINNLRTPHVPRPSSL